jgi:succinate-acetate transporter protein
VNTEPSAQVVLRPIASPLALGFVGLAMGTTILSALQLSWVPAAQQRFVAIALLGFVAPLQGLASVFGFLGRDTVVATGMGILSGTWAVIGWSFLASSPGSTSDALGIVLLVSGASMLIPATSAMVSKLVPAVILATAAARLAVSGAYELTGSSAWEIGVGWGGVALGILALYGALAIQLEDVLGTSVLPVGRIGQGRAAIRGTPARQTSGLEHEAGVRQQL